MRLARVGGCVWPWQLIDAVVGVGPVVSVTAVATQTRFANRVFVSGAFHTSTPNNEGWRVMAGTFRVPCVTPTPNPLPTASVQGYSTKTGPVFPAKPQSPARAFRLGVRRHVAANASLSSTNANVQQSLSSAEDKQSAEDLQTAASTSNKNASAVGVVVTSQANFLRVVVRPEGMTQVQSLARTAQLQSAMDAAVAAGKLDDAERLSKKMNETGRSLSSAPFNPHRFLLTLHSTLNKD